MDDYIQKVITDLTLRSDIIKKKLLTFPDLNLEFIDGLVEKVRVEGIPVSLPFELDTSLRALHLIQNLISNINDMPDQLDRKEIVSVCKFFWEAGLMTGASLPSLDALGNRLLYDTKGIHAVLKSARDERYADSRETLNRAAEVARQQWVSGSNLLHHQMKKYLVEEYRDEGGKYPFLSLPDKSLLEAVKRVAKEMNRPDLISGHKKTK